jgi:5'-3' exonuclease
MKPITVLVDTSVIIHQLQNMITPILPPTHWEGVVNANLAVIQSGAWLGVLRQDAPLQTVFLMDTKPYWRADYLKSPEFVGASVEQKKKNANKDGVAYKTGRKFPSHELTKVKKLVYGCLKSQGWLRIGQPGYEADDCAAGIVQVNKALGEPHRIILLTIDTDWLGLVSEHVSWVSSVRYFPQVRADVESINIWAEKKLGKITQPTDIWLKKSEQGDKSDNIPGWGDIVLPVIDLFNPPEQYKLWEQEPFRTTVEDYLLYPRTSRTVSQEEAERAYEYLRKTGIKPILRVLDVESFAGGKSVQQVNQMG